MSLTDPIANLLTSIRNGQCAGKRWVDVPASTLKSRILYILKEESYIDNFIIIVDGHRKILRAFLKYDKKGEPVIRYLKKISKPGRRVYAKAGSIPPVVNGLGVAILTTSKGVISDKVARKMKVGGEILCNIW